ncbi:MAG: Ni/Fe hydrogenase subunit alpha [Planctomycetes bacterium]|nr:Ni/Fe hydrogenase subunit alpha [Planctomycetota bacterium]
MKVTLNVDLHHLPRVEGHGNVIVRVDRGSVVDARWEVVETPRYFEVMLKGKHFRTAALLVSRICGICSIGHTLASVRATERAFGVEPPPLAAKLRLLAKHGETIQSHALHLFFLAAPDFLDLPSVLPLVEACPDVVALAARLKGVGNRLCDVVAGRTTHPVSIQVGGMAVRPARADLDRLRHELVSVLPDLESAVQLFRGFKLPEFERETEFVALKGEGSYPWIGGRLISTDGVEKDEDEYRAMTNEYVVEHGTSKWCRLSRDSFAVGALARFNNNFRFLRPEAKKVAAALGLAPIDHNPYRNDLAQLVELVHCVHEALLSIDEIQAAPSDAELRAPVVPRAGSGVGAVEVPRGILYHRYTYDSEGYVVSADCVIPTTQNNKNIHNDVVALVHSLAKRGVSDREAERLCAMLVRAYDPCISCSVH